MSVKAEVIFSVSSSAWKVVSLNERAKTIAAVVIHSRWFLFLVAKRRSTVLVPLIHEARVLRGTPR
ncbi:wsv368 [White spot syndrome virus]|uniref:Wsv368 n=4 Tax=White spot syndrome virus TaxID=342409 RepID=Q8VAN3_WSSVS|nr:wsv368 [Shrimp white spot syndrome virus]AFX59745.1 wsv368 [White spot syndrome virus]AAL33370.1 wsv368 [Shrimp white spot syndrome virus]AAL89295.1 WSSV427 [Shrimp white spot syndrome virus]AWQ60494.1 wsv368 [Shrimp white spot syndrome virus]AWQ60939.1 wsv368 [Shrimp white spot syndrome virus]